MFKRKFVFTWLGTAVTTMGIHGKPAEDLVVLLKPAEDPAINRAAWDRLVEKGPRAIPAILKAWRPDDPVAANWLRSAFDEIVRRNAATIDVEAMKGFALDAKNPGKARRLALRGVEEVFPGTTAKLLPKMLDDAEFGPDAVDALVTASATAATPEGMTRMLEEAYAAAREPDQVLSLAKKLSLLEIRNDPVSKLGIVGGWKIVGPFHAGTDRSPGGKYPPEENPDFGAEYQAKAGKLKWLAGSLNPEGKIDLLKNRIQPSDGGVAFAQAILEIPEEIQGDLFASAMDNITLWLNGKEILNHSNPSRSHYRQDRFRVPAKLKKGSNQILVKLTKTPAEEGGRPGAPPRWDFQIRLVDEKGRSLLAGKTGEPK
jgi:hypothetical protein